MKADAWQQGLKPSYKFYVILSIAKSRIEQKQTRTPPPNKPKTWLTESGLLKNDNLQTPRKSRATLLIAGGCEVLLFVTPSYRMLQKKY